MADDTSTTKLARPNSRSGLYPYDRWLLMKPYVVQGMSDYAVARALGFSRPSVFWTRRKFQNNDVRPDVPHGGHRSAHDWKAIQKKYDEGCSWREIRDIFGVGFKSIHLAKKRGDLKTGRSISDGLRIAHRKGRANPPPLTAEHRKATSIRQSTANSGGRSKWFDVAGRKVQGRWERDLALKFEDWGVRWVRLNGKKSAWPYMLDGKHKHYTPDFYLPDIRLWVEVKGYWWGDDMRKMVAIGRRYPRRRLVIIGKREFQDIVSSPTIPDIFSGA